MGNETEIRVIDSMMGGGKTSAAINYINNSEGEHILYITPYLSEIEDRIIPLCREKDFVTPDADMNGTKLKDLRKLLKEKRNIAATHALFDKFDSEIAGLIDSAGYTLIMDEVADVVNTWKITPDDLRMLKRDYITVDENTGQFCWRENEVVYKGAFAKERYLCRSKQLYKYGDSMAIQLFPVGVFSAFRKVFILTYMFDAQIQRYYCDFFGLKYRYAYVRSGENGYVFTDEVQPPDMSVDYRRLIHIEEHEKLNRIGSRKQALSKAWFQNAGSKTKAQLKNNTLNFFVHIAKSKSDNNLWTTFKGYKTALQGKGYTKGFIPCNIRATNLYRDKTAFAYLLNVYMNPVIRCFFASHGVEIDEDRYALSEMLQCLWRSAIRDGKEITVYIPSSRMRGLLMKWIEDNSPERI